MLHALQCGEKGKEMPTVEKAKCVVVVLSHLTSTALMKPKQQDQHGAGKNLHTHGERKRFSENEMREKLASS